MHPPPADADRLAAAARLALRGRPLSSPNPAVGAILVKNDVVVGRGWTQSGGRPHAEAMALAQAGAAARGSTCFVTLEPCAHRSERGPACADVLVEAGVTRVVAGIADPDPRTAGKGMARLREAGIEAVCIDDPASRASLAGYLTRSAKARPHVTLKLALSQDGRLAPRTGQWLTGDIARAHVHAWRAKMDAILVGRGTFDSDAPRLDVRLPGLETRSPDRWLLTSGPAPDGWRAIAQPADIMSIAGAQWLMVEGGAQTARAFLGANLVDTVMLYRAPMIVGGDGVALAELADTDIGAGWTLASSRPLGTDRLDVYERSPCSPA